MMTKQLDTCDIFLVYWRTFNQGELLFICTVDIQDLHKHIILSINV
jgi:hypothetical protein